jgi:small-conductance mechanosensitive channel
MPPGDHQGVDSLDDTGVVLLMRIRTVPGKHLLVGRAFNRLVKIAFDEQRVAGRDPAAAVVISRPSIDQPADEPHAAATQRRRA